MTPAEFIDVFLEGWSRPQPDGWIDYFRPLSHPDVVATQPMLPAAVGVDAYMRSFRDLFALVKDMRVDVLRTATTDDTAFIESHITATIGGRPMSFDVTDRFVLRDGLIYRRHTYFDPTPVVVAILMRPWVLPAVLRSLRG